MNPTINQLQDIAETLRHSAFQVCQRANSGHIGASSSSAELLTALYFGGVLRYDNSQLHHPKRDRVLLRGHLGPLRYSLFAMMGILPEESLTQYRQIHGLPGHETMDIPGVDITPSGSLGMVLSYAVGSALVGRAKGQDFTTYVFIGDGEEQEGNISEAARHASHEGLDSIVAIIDANKGQLSDRIERLSQAHESVAKIWDGYGWNVSWIQNGHDINEILEVFSSLEKRGVPQLIIAKTEKGKGIPGYEKHYSGYHTISTCNPKDVSTAIQSSSNPARDSQSKKLIKQYISRKELPLASIVQRKDYDFHFDFEALSEYKMRTSIDEHKGQELHNHIDAWAQFFMKFARWFKQNNKPFDFYLLTADMMPEEIVQKSRVREFSHYYNVGIREQHLVATAHGISVTDPNARIVLNYPDAFIYRAIDQLSALALEDSSHAIFYGSFGGITNSQNGATHQTTSQMSALINMHGLTYLEPADAEDFFGCLSWAMSKGKGPIYIRSHYLGVPILPSIGKKSIGWYPVTLKEDAELNVISSGMPASAAWEASVELEKEERKINLINIVNPNSLGRNFYNSLRNNVPTLILYNGDAHILSDKVAGRMLELGINLDTQFVLHGFSKGTTGTLPDLLAHFKLDKGGIYEKIRELIK